MDKIAILNRVKEIYQNNGNIINYLKGLDGRTFNTLEDILISYDFQAGTYTNAYKNNDLFRESRGKLCDELTSVIEKLGQFNSILEAGVGEATSLALIISNLSKCPVSIYGFDVSWSRIKYAREFLIEMGIDSTQLFVGDLFNTPIANDSIDIVYTVHAVEPNGGREEEALKELYRITRKFLILVEPSYHFADEEARKRMRSHGYVTRLYEKAIELGYEVIEHRLTTVHMNPANPSSLIVIKKNGDNVERTPLCCPNTKSSLIEGDGCYYSPDSFLAYPVIDRIPCLLPQNAIVATKYLNP
ncbi:methyltransferase domain-containing protein [Paenibacillus dendritiformis]|uniref:Methyltransferase domain-containing protein n=1 Tax=Paenibacillus dendritiformis C454 TaxID=1131935 RepID=H3S9S7_9BACL|nr:methyltransferase domain-containing protein [Paenibacillus dendritiformis]EHQ64195.1 hypothetical protein PDENDC454_01300 [Paenibacillus dendritiformis C454]CAH8767384.1 methyltransferase domain-containing protein [Paenibacillus dendritiformis]